MLQQHARWQRKKFQLMRASSKKIQWHKKETPAVWLGFPPDLVLIRVRPDSPRPECSFTGLHPLPWMSEQLYRWFLTGK